MMFKLNKLSLAMFLATLLGLITTNSYGDITDHSKQSVNVQANDTAVHNVLAREVKWVHPPQFNFPNELRQISQSGDTYSLKMALTIGLQGEVTNANIIESSGISDLDRHTLRMVRTAKFAPYLINSQPILARFIIPVNYKVP